MLDNIGFYTLTEERAKTASITTPLSRCELILTSRCNFSCQYCRGLKYTGDLPKTVAFHQVWEWGQHGLKAIRFSGGEPTLWPHIIPLVEYAQHQGVDKVAISTNGSSSSEMYYALVKAGVNDFSISLDACCAATNDVMCGSQDRWKHTVDMISNLSALVYTTVGIVVNSNNAAEVTETIALAASLGVADIRVIPAAAEDTVQLPLMIYSHSNYPILHYRLDRMKGRHIRGLLATDYNRCPLVLDDVAVAGGFHFPCIIYLREGGEPIGAANDSSWREDRADWAEKHNTYKDKICKGNCLDVCVDYNNRWNEYHMEEDK